VNVTIIGFGEAGPVFAKAMQEAGNLVSAYDQLQQHPTLGEAQCKKTTDAGVKVTHSAEDAVQDADLVISTVTASEAIKAADQASNGLQRNTHWLDLNSVSPDTKAAIAQRVIERGCGFTEAVAMDTVPTKGAGVPLLMCGPQAQHWCTRLNEAGLNTAFIGVEYGRASTTKLMRSIVIKGMEALFAESMEAAAQIGVQKEVLESLHATYPGLDWEEVAGYQLSRAVLHAKRRAAEMREATAVVDKLGVTPIMANAIAQKQQSLFDRKLASVYQGNLVDDFINSVNRAS